jgi:hypothetical protein
MKRNFTQFANLLILILLPGILLAQDYNLKLKSGNFIPEENSRTISKSDPVFTNSSFDGKHYVTIQFNSIPTQSVKDQLRSAGIQLIDYIPNFSYTAIVSDAFNTAQFASYGVRSVFYLDVRQKMQSDLFNAIYPPHAVNQFGFVDVEIITYEKIGAEKIAPALQQIGASILSNTPVFKTYKLRLPQSTVNMLAAMPFVQWVEPISPPNVLENLPGRSLHRANVLNDGVRNLKGDGINVGVWDGGAINSTHIDFLPTGRVTVVEPGSLTDHGTHVTGTITSKGLVNPSARGMAPNANIFGWNFSGDVQAEMAAGIPANNLLVSSHSYGFSFSGSCNINNSLLVYETRSRNTDINLNNFPNHLHVHSSGNSQASCSGVGGFFTITGSGKPAKNNLVVANITSTEGLSGSSSCGPVQDGRIKPEISAMGTNVFSTWSPGNSSYTTISGTSMATPGVSGTSVLLYQRYKQLNANAEPPSTLIKNIICNGAQDLGNAGPDYKFGFGRINALTAVKILEQNRYQLNSVGNGSSNDVNITVPAGATQLKVMLTWNDPAATANANPALVNDLDLTANSGATTTLPWILDKNNPNNLATRGVDNYSNIEQITIDNPPSGSYTLRVNGTTVTSGTQSYALTWIIDQPYTEVTYPNGGEAFNPGSSEVITWDNSGVTGNQTVEYSLDNGATWTVINTVGPTTSRLTWLVPSASTSTALIRVTSGSLTDVSDATFRILGTVTGLTASGASCNSGEVIFSWTPVTNATNYDILRLDETTTQFVTVASNVTGTTHTATGLTPGATFWFTIVAKNSTSGAVSERAVAVSATVSSGGGGLGAIGGITGQNIICGTPTGVPYSIASVTGATNYTWTAPPGAVIASGQGTTNITINYPGGSTSGNVIVFASNGVCQTTNSTLAINVSGTSVPAPVSGGNQTANVCPGNTIPTLTATATVGTGYSLVWYNAATGGSVISNPILSTVGSITYHAAAIDNSTNCESTTRTPVTLTINQVPVASITAGGPVTFCQGGSVTLTANTGTSYLWSNGATTQSITVNTGGNYTVQVTTGTCVSTSAATTVTVNTPPVANISAGGPLTFCQGLNVMLTASAGSSWLWSNGATTQSITVTTSGNYTVTVTNAAGCSATSTATTVTVNPNPPALITAGGATTFCNGGSVTLTANSGTAYLWSNGATTQSITLSGPIGTTNYSVQVTQAGGCVSSSPNTAVTVNPVPVASITAGGATTVCEPNTVVLTASAGSSWLWSNGATTQSITISSPAASGNYTVRVTNSSGCFANSSATTVTINPRPVVTLSASPYTRLYPGLKTTLTATVTPPGTYIYTWYKNNVVVPGATTASLGVDLNKLGSYTVQVVNAGGCSNTSNLVEIADSATARLFIMPNPNNGQFDISYYSATANNYTVVITDSKGSLVYSKAFSITTPYQRLAIDIRKNGSGVYTIALTDRAGKRIAVGRVLVSH